MRMMPRTLSRRPIPCVPRKSLRSPAARLLLNALLLGLTAVATHGQSVWQGTVNDSWATAGNWSGGAPSTTSGSPSNISIGGFDLNGDTLTLDGTYHVNSLVVLGADYGLTDKQLAAAGTAGSKLVFQATAGGANPALTLNMLGTGTVTDHRSLTLGADMVLEDDLTLTRVGGGSTSTFRRVTLDGVISGDGALTLTSNTTSSGGRILFNRHNTFTGDVHILAGYVAQAYADSLGVGNKTLHFADTGAVTWDLTASTISAANGGTTISYNIALSTLSGARALLLHGGTTQRQLRFTGNLTGGSAIPSVVSLWLIAQNNQQLIFEGANMSFGGKVTARYGSEVVIAAANAGGVAWENVSEISWSETLLAGTHQSGFLLRGDFTFHGDVSVMNTTSDYTDKLSVGQINHNGAAYDATFTGDIRILESDYRSVNLVSESGGSATFQGNIVIAGEQGMDVNQLVNPTTSGGTIRYYEAAPTGTVVLGATSRVASTLNGTGSIGVAEVMRGTLLVNTSHFYGSLDVYAGARAGGTGKVTGDVFLYGGAPGGELSAGGDATSPVGSLEVTGTVYVNAGARVVFDVAGATFNVGGTSVGDIATLFASQLEDVGDHDHLEIAGALNLSAAQSLHFNSLNGYKPTWGDAFHLLDFGVLNAGALTAEQLWLLPTLADANWEWNFDLFNQNGILVVTPEPTRGVLLLLAAMGAILRRNRMKRTF